MNPNANHQTKGILRKIHCFQSAWNISLAHHKRLQRWDVFLSMARLIITLIFLGLFSIFFKTWDPVIRVGAVVLFLMVFLALSHIHQWFQERVEFWKTAAQSYQVTLSRIQRDWQTLKTHQNSWHKALVQSVPPTHVYARDLDIAFPFFDLLNTCILPQSSQRLWDQILTCGIHPPDHTQRQQQQKIYKQLAQQPIVLRRLDIERLRVDQQKQPHDLKKNPLDISDLDTISGLWWRGLYGILSVLAWCGFVPYWVVSFINTGHLERFLTGLVLYMILPAVGIAVFKTIFEVSSHLKTLLKTLNPILNLCAPVVDAQFVSKADLHTLSFKSLERLCDLISFRENPIAWFVLNTLIPFDPLICLAALVSLRRQQKHLPQAVEQCIQWDVACAFGRFAWENPEFHFIQNSPQAGTLGTHTTPEKNLILHMEHMGHPLIPADKRILNTLTVHQDNALIILTGSNMSGKSTFLRSLGLNVLLHNLGAPVCATHVYAPPLNILCAIRTDDSLTQETSYFYAEVKRIKGILDTITGHQESPCLFLIDEIFKGTNNRERLIGSWSLLKHLATFPKAFGIVSTHDLALTELAKESGQNIDNMHFREHIEGDHLTFDYTLREGPCPTTNALHIMRVAGLPIEEHIPTWLLKT